MILGKLSHRTITPKHAIEDHCLGHTVFSTSRVPPFPEIHTSTGQDILIPLNQAGIVVIWETESHGAREYLRPLITLHSSLTLYEACAISKIPTS